MKERITTKELIDVDASKNQNGNNHGCENKAKRAYSKMTITPITIEMENPLLAGSVVNNSKITSAGQEIGPSFDFSSDIDSNTGKTFSYEWESGNN